MSGNMRSMMLFLFVLIGQPVFAQGEMVWDDHWTCDGFKHADGSRGEAFDFFGDGSVFRFYDTVPRAIMRVSENQVIGFDIFVDTGRNTHRNAYYLKQAGDRLTIMGFHWEFGASKSDCLRQ